MTEEESFLTAIAAEPDDNTARLVYADWLDEQEPPQGGVTSNTDRAELIRLQIALSPHSHAWSWDADRERELLAAHPEWTRCPCPECGGTGERTDDPHIRVTRIGERTGNALCLFCHGTGDLMRVRLERNEGYGHTPVLRPHRFARGFLESITLPFTGAGGAFEFEEVDERQEYQLHGSPVIIRRWRSTRLARELVRHFDTVTQVELDEGGPYHLLDRNSLVDPWAFDYQGENWPAMSGGHCLPKIIHKELTGRRWHTIVYYRTREDGLKDLARAVAKAIRRELK